MSNTITPDQLLKEEAELLQAAWTKHPSGGWVDPSGNHHNIETHFAWRRHFYRKPDNGGRALRHD